jgi:hypothetical protein
MASCGGLARFGGDGEPVPTPVPDGRPGGRSGQRSRDSIRFDLDPVRGSRRRRRGAELLCGGARGGWPPRGKRRCWEAGGATEQRPATPPRFVLELLRLVLSSSLSPSRRRAAASLPASPLFGGVPSSSSRRQADRERRGCGMAPGSWDGAPVRDPLRNVGLWRSLGRRQLWGIRLANGTCRMDCRPPVRGGNDISIGDRAVAYRWRTPVQTASRSRGVFDMGHFGWPSPLAAVGRV